MNAIQFPPEVIEYDEQRKAKKEQTGAIAEPEAIPWPDDFANEAYHGLAGEVVREIEPYTEADKAALLMNFLVAFGNVIGRQVYMQVGADKHFGNLFCLLIGNTAKARKGTSWGPIRELFRRVDEQWVKDRVCGGLTSGEGLVWTVRDPIWGKEKNRKTGETKDVVIDEGVKDKRLLIIETEFSSVLKVAQREGNTLKEIIRQAWDGHKLQGLSKNSPAKATEPHVSIVGHITAAELKKYQESTDLYNGFSNRFLWVCVRRSKLLPEGPEIPDDVYLKLVPKLKDVLRWVGELRPVERKFQRNKEAAQVWRMIYQLLNDEAQGAKTGSVTSRADAQMIRLSLLYAALDKTNTIKPEHIMAALAVWQRCQQSVEYFFSEDGGPDPIEAKIMEGLRKGPMSQAEIYRNIFQCNISAKKITEALQNLSAKGKVECKEIKQEQGRKKKIWSLS
jgi:hypothetical protein